MWKAEHLSHLMKNLYSVVYLFDCASLVYAGQHINILLHVHEHEYTWMYAITYTLAYTC